MSTRPPCIALTSGLGAARGYGPLFLTVLIAFGGSLVALGFAPTFAVVLLILVGANALGAVTDVLAQTLIQLAVPSGLRARAGGAWVVSIGTRRSASSRSACSRRCSA